MRVSGGQGGTGTTDPPGIPRLVSMSNRLRHVRLRCPSNMHTDMSTDDWRRQRGKKVYKESTCKTGIQNMRTGLVCIEDAHLYTFWKPYLRLRMDVYTGMFMDACAGCRCGYTCLCIFSVTSEAVAAIHLEVCVQTCVQGCA